MEHAQINNGEQFFSFRKNLGYRWLLILCVLSLIIMPLFWILATTLWGTSPLIMNTLSKIVAFFYFLNAVTVTMHISSLFKHETIFFMRHKVHKKVYIVFFCYIVSLALYSASEFMNGCINASGMMCEMFLALSIFLSYLVWAVSLIAFSCYSIFLFYKSKKEVY